MVREGRVMVRVPQVEAKCSDSDGVHGVVVRVVCAGVVVRVVCAGVAVRVVCAWCSGEGGVCMV